MSREKKFPDVPKEAIVKPEDERSAKTEIKPEEVENRDERLKSADHDMDSDDHSDFDPEV